MKTIKIIMIPLFILIQFLFNNCKKEMIREYYHNDTVVIVKTNDSLHLGKTQSNFTVDTVYLAKTDGFLSVDFTIPMNSSTLLTVYSDSLSNPKTKVASLSNQSMVTIPIQNGYYWKVHKESANDLGNILIYWTPIEK